MTKYTQIGPMMSLIGVEGRVVQSGDHFGHRPLRIGSGDDCRPRLFLARLELRYKMFPFDRELFVSPRHADMMRLQIRTVLAHLA